MSSHDLEKAPGDASPQEITSGGLTDGDGNGSSGQPNSKQNAGDTSIVIGTENGATLLGHRSALLLCWVFGIGSLLSWYTMLSIGDYYYHVFPKYHPSRVLAFVYQPFLVVTMALLAFYISKVNSRWRNNGGFGLFFLATLGCLLLDVITSGGGELTNYAILCIFVGLFGIADALVRGGISGDLASMPSRFMQSYYAGMAASGTFASVLRIITKAAIGGIRKGALLFMSIAVGIELICLCMYPFFSNLPIVKYYRAKGTNQVVDAVCLTQKQLLFLNWDYALVIYLTYVLSMSIFPGFLYENTGSHSLGSWYPVLLIAAYNLSDFISRYSPLVKVIKMESRKGLVILTLSRFLFVPLFYFTARYGAQGWMFLLTFLLGFSNGYLTVHVMTLAPKGYRGQEQKALGNLLVLFLAFGLLSGISLDWLWIFT